MKGFFKKTFKIFFVFVLAVVAGLFVVFGVVRIFTNPSNERDWNLDQSVLPYADIDGDVITIHNIRNFNYRSTTDYDAHYYQADFDLNKIKEVWYVVEPFSGIPGSAHTFLSFEFEGDQFVAFSVEIRKEVGESFHPIKGLFNQYELMYVVADERDVVKLRSNYRKDLVYVYPAKSTKEKISGLFVDMVKRVNKLYLKPEFYNTVTNTCTTNIVQHINSVTPKRVPLFNIKVLLPADSDKLAYDLGLIDTDLTFEEARERFFINDRALKYADDPNFSALIRGEK